MEYKSKSKRSRQAGDLLLRVNRQGLTAQRSLGPDLSVRHAPLLSRPQVSPRQLHLQRSEKQLSDFTVSPVTAQRQALAPMFEGLQLQRDVLSLKGPDSHRQSLQRQIENHQVSLGAPGLHAGQYEAAVQRVADLQTPAAPLTQRPSTPAQWTQGGLWEVQRVADAGKPGQTVSLREQEQSQHLGLLRTVGTQLGQGFRSDTGPAVQRYAEYGAALAPFQRLGTGTGRAVVTTALMQVPVSQRQALQRAIDDTIQRQQAQESQDRAIIGLHSLQRQLYHLDAQGEQPVMEQIQARRGAGNPIPTALRRALELELNHDLSRVRLHDDAEADMLAKKVNAVAFTTGQDVFFRAGTFNPNTRTGVELIAHEVKHTKQQAQGTARPGIDGDAGQEHDARSFGSQFAAKVDLDALVGQAVSRAIKSSPNAALHTQSVQRVPARAPSKSKKPAVKSISINRRGGVLNDLNLYGSPGTNAKLIVTLRAGSTFFVKEEVEGGWYRISSGSVSGFVNLEHVKLAPDNDAVLHKIAKREPAITIAREYNKSDIDTRTYVNILHHINPKAIPNPSTNKNWQDAMTLENLWIWIPGRSFAEKLRSVVKSGKLSDVMFDSVKEGATAVVKATIGQLPGGPAVLATLQKIGGSGEQVLGNPGKFVRHFGEAVSQGFGKFQADLPRSLEKSVVSLFTGTMTEISPPKIWDATGILHVGLQMVGGTPEQLEARLIRDVPGGMTAINASSGAKNALNEIQTNGFAATAINYYKSDGPALTEMIIGGVKSYVLNTVVKEGLKTLMSMFIPGAGIIQAAIKLYETIRFVWDKFAELSKTAEAITDSLAAIAAGAIGPAATKISASLEGMLGLGVNFLARIAHLDGIAAKVRALFDKVKAPIQKAINQVILKFKRLVDSKNAKPIKKATTTNNKTYIIRRKFVMNNIIHTLVLQRRKNKTATLEMHSREDILSAKISRRLESLKGDKTKIPEIQTLQHFYQRALEIESMSAKDADMQELVNEELGTLAKEIASYGKRFKLNDIETEDGNVEFKALIAKANFIPASKYKKHVQGNSEENRRKFSANGGPGQFYHRFTDSDIQTLEREVLTTGNVVKRSGGFHVFYKFSTGIGYANGKDTKGMRAEMTDAPVPDVHSHPRDLP